MWTFKSKFIFAVLFGISCQANTTQTPTASIDSGETANLRSSVPGNFSDQGALRFEESKIGLFLIKYPQLITAKKEIDSFYSNRQYAFAWFDNKGIIDQASSLYNHIRNITGDGVSDKLPYTLEFDALMQKADSGIPDVETEIMFTAQYFLYARHVWAGLTEKETKSINWYLPRKKISYDSMLNSLLSGSDVLNSPPVYRQYTLLKSELRKYRDIQKAGGLAAIIPDKKSLKEGDTSQSIVAIRKWLLASGDLTGNVESNIFNSDLVAAVKSFQQRFGLNVDGVINPSLVKEMNVPLDARMQQIIVNMERSRWIPVSREADYLVINIPEYKLHAYEHDSLLWSMDAVVGKPVHKTVIFTGNIKYVVFSPYWNVPPSILNNEILPGIRRNKNYLVSHNMEWSDGQVRQRSGPDNALGLVKFLFPNSYNIYLHDTPTKSLFGESSRAFSHGCIRLSDAEKLANYLLVKDPVWTPEAINKAMKSGKEKFVTLQKLETVFIVYFTSWVDSLGKLNFRKDIYNRDSRLANMLLNNAAL